MASCNTMVAPITVTVNYIPVEEVPITKVSWAGRTQWPADNTVAATIPAGTGLSAVSIITAGKGDDGMADGSLSAIRLSFADGTTSDILSASEAHNTGVEAKDLTTYTASLA
jgi:hypothetical protein